MFLTRILLSRSRKEATILAQKREHTIRKPTRDGSSPSQSQLPFSCTLSALYQILADCKDKESTIITMPLRPFFHPEMLSLSKWTALAPALMSPSICSPLNQNGRIVVTINMERSLFCNGLRCCFCWFGFADSGLLVVLRGFQQSFQSCNRPIRC